MSLIKHYLILCLFLTNIYSYGMEITWNIKPINTQNDEGNTRLHLSVINDDSAGCINDLILFGADITQTNNNNQTPIDIAKEQGKVELVTTMTATHNKVIQLLDMITNNPQRTLLELSAGISRYHHFLPFIDRAVIVKTCVTKGALNATTPNKDTPLHLAALSSDQYIAAFLLKYGANPKALNKQGDNPLHLAARENNPDFINLLLTHTPELIHIKDADGDTPLHIAALCNTPDATIIALLSKGADINQTNKRNQTPIDMAQRDGNTKLANLMLEWTQEYSKNNKGHS